jgi:predicted esterase
MFGRTLKIWVVLLIMSSGFAVAKPPHPSALHAPHSKAPEAPRKSELSRLWHEAGMAYSRNDMYAARDTYRVLLHIASLRTISPAETPSAAWYVAMSNFGIARISSRFGDTSDTRVALLGALRGEFWAFDALERDSIIRNVAGQHWFDSLIATYKILRQISTPTWSPQEPLVIVPAGDPCLAARVDTLGGIHALRMKHALGYASVATMDSATRHNFRKLQTLKMSEVHHMCDGHPPQMRPVIVALHGGCASYLEFAKHWCRVADSLGVFVLVPAGTARYSQDLNSWEGSIESIDASVSAAVDALEKNIGYTPDWYVAGFSQGAMSAIKVGLMHPDRYRAAISIAGLLDGPLPDDAIAEGAKQGLSIYAMSGEFDSPNFRASLEEAGKQCDQAGLPFHFELLPQTVHEVPSDFTPHFAKAWSWVQERERSRMSQSMR